MSCCFRKPKETYEFDDEPKNKNKKNKNKKNKNAKNGHAKIEDIIPENKDAKQQQEEDVAILVNGEPLTETSHANPDTVDNTDTTNLQKPTEDENQKDNVSNADEKIESDTNSDKDTKEEETQSVTNKDDEDKTADTKTEDTKTENDEDDKNNNSEKTGEVIVISRDTRNSFYGAALLKMQEAQRHEQEKSEKETEKEEALKKKMETLKQMHAARKEEVTEKMEEEKNTDEPAPDYSDEESENKDEDYVALRKTVKNRISTMLTRDEWDQILDRSALSDEEKEVNEPEPDYEGAHKSKPVARAHTFNVGASSDGVKSPDDKVRQNLQRELMMNQKFGIDVLHRKSELQKEFSKRKDREKQKEKESPRRNSFEAKLEQMAHKIQKQGENGKIQELKPDAEDDSLQPEFMRIHSKIYKAKPPVS